MSNNLNQTAGPLSVISWRLLIHLRHFDKNQSFWESKNKNGTGDSLTLKIFKKLGPDIFWFFKFKKETGNRGYWKISDNCPNSIYNVISKTNQSMMSNMLSQEVFALNHKPWNKRKVTMTFAGVTRLKIAKTCCQHSSQFRVSWDLFRVEGLGLSLFSISTVVGT